MIRVKDLTLTPPGCSVPMFEKASLSVRPGETAMLVGPAGAGKSTLLRVIGDLYAPVGKAGLSGTVEVDGRTPKEARAAGVFSYVLEKPVLLPWRTVRENLSPPSAVRALPSRPPGEVLAAVDLSGCKDLWPGELSPAARAALALGRAISRSPRVLLLDAPFDGLPPPERERLEELILRLKRVYGLTVMMATHSLHTAAYLGDTLYEAGGEEAPGLRRVRVPFGPRTPPLKETPEFSDFVDSFREKGPWAAYIRR